MPLKYLTGLALKESTTEWGRCLSGREQWSKEQLKYTVFLARSGTSDEDLCHSVALYLKASFQF